MKNFYLLTAILLIPFLTHAQLKVDSIGRVGIATTPNDYYKLQVAALNSQGVLIQREGTPQGLTQIGLSVSSQANSGTFSYGLYSRVLPYTYNSIVHTGVYGMSSGSPFQNYGIFGRINFGNKGAAVCGSINNADYVNIDTCYAGYFHGLTHVQGNFSVSGTINGVLLSNSSSLRSSLFDDASTVNSITYRLQGLTAHAFFISGPVPAETPSLAEKLGEADSMFEERNMVDDFLIKSSTIEKQVFSKQHFGLDADQLEEVFPDLVYEQEDGTKSINYVEMVPILVQAINELKCEIEALKSRNSEGNQKVMKYTSEGRASEKLISLSLGQNKPNPFSNSTTIEVCIPKDVQKTFIYVYDLQGKKVEQVDITARGKQNVQFTSANLTDGMYLYSLIADGKVIETKRMIVEK